MQANEQVAGTQMESAIMQGVQTPELASPLVLKRVREENLLLDLEERKQNLEERKQRIKAENTARCLDHIKRLDEFIGLDDRDRLYYKDMMKMAFENKPGYSGFLTDSLQVNNEENQNERGREISIALVCQELGVNPRGKSSQIGRIMAKRWREAHPGEEIPKRDTLYNGRPYKENVYYQCDYDMLAGVIEEVLL